MDLELNPPFTSRANNNFARYFVGIYMRNLKLTASIVYQTLST